MAEGLLVIYISERLYVPGPGLFYLSDLSKRIDWVVILPPFNFTTFGLYAPGPGVAFIDFSFRNATFTFWLFWVPIFTEEEEREGYVE